MQQVISDLLAAQIGQVLVNEPLAGYTTWKIGGPADVLIVPDGKKKLAETLKLLHRQQIPWTLIGRGSNILIADKGIRGVVIKLGPEMEEVRFDDETIYAGAAFSFIKLSVLAGKHGLTGLEFAGGIPGSVGGAVYMNAGAHGSDVSRTLKYAEIMLETGESIKLSAKDMQYAYRNSLLQHQRGIVTEAVFQLQYGDRKEIAAAMATYKDRRLRTQPLPLACAGSVFRNPENHYSAQLIEQAGLKGMRVGGAEVSTQHANFIINTGQATAEDVISLMEQIRAIILEKSGIVLVPEVMVVGER